MVDTFKVGELYSNSEIFASLGVGNAGGVRATILKNGSVARLAIMTSVSDARQIIENPYHDRIEGDILVYTGAGRLGNQNLGGANARIVQQLTQRFPIYGFILMSSRRNVKLGSKRWAFLGLLEYLRHYPETQHDSKMLARRAWMFELKMHQVAVAVRSDTEIMEELLASRSSVTNLADDREVIGASASENDLPGAEQLAIEPIRRKLLGYEPKQFEIVLKELLVQSGFEKVEVTRYSQDGGIDVNAYPGPLSWPIRTLLVQLQAKRWLHTVGRKEVAELRGSLMPHARGCIVTRV